MPSLSLDDLDGLIIEVLSESPEEEIERLDDLCFSVCAGCGQDLRFDTAYIDDELKLWFICGECHEESDLQAFLGNVTFTEPIACIACGKEFKTWDFECASCGIEYEEDDWAEYIAFLLDVGVYGEAPQRKIGFGLLVDNIKEKEPSYREAYENYVEEIYGLCYMCGADRDDCVCHPQESLTLIDYVFIPDNIKDASFYHSVLTIPNKQYAQSCYNCTKQYTSRCEKLPEQLLTIGLNHLPAYKLDTCEYIDVSIEIISDMPDDKMPF